jgi:hypothetical protein
LPEKESPEKVKRRVVPGSRVAFSNEILTSRIPLPKTILPPNFAPKKFS